MASIVIGSRWRNRAHASAGQTIRAAARIWPWLQHSAAGLTAPDIKLQAKAYYNLGNVHYRLGQQAEDLDKLEEAWKESLNQFKHAVALDNADQNAAFNRTFVEERLKQIELLRAMARQAKEAADNATRQRNYRGALQIMEQLMQQAQAVAKPFEEFTKKLKQIDEIVNPSPQQVQPRL